MNVWLTVAFLNVVFLPEMFAGEPSENYNLIFLKTDFVDDHLQTRDLFVGFQQIKLHFEGLF